MKSLRLKNTLDFFGAAAGLLILSPLMIIIAILTFRRMGSPVLFQQERPGLNGKPFMMYKFRSMTNDRNANGELLPPRYRLTAFGELLRKTSLDELPELFNVLKGEMSLVGPRPLLMEYLDRYSPEQARRHEVKPGITGWAQVNGRNAITWEEKFKLDVWYVDNRSIWLDVNIIWKTLTKVLKREDLNTEGYVGMPKFWGSNGQIIEGTAIEDGSHDDNVA